jgi:hypothetical protein
MALTAQNAVNSKNGGKPVARQQRNCFIRGYNLNNGAPTGAGVTFKSFGGTLPKARQILNDARDAVNFACRFPAKPRVKT